MAACAANAVAAAWAAPAEAHLPFLHLYRRSLCRALKHNPRIGASRLPPLCNSKRAHAQPDISEQAFALPGQQ